MCWPRRSIWSFVLGITALIRRSRSHGSSLRYRKLASKDAPPQTSTAWKPHLSRASHRGSRSSVETRVASLHCWPSRGVRSVILIRLDPVGAPRSPRMSSASLSMLSAIDGAMADLLLRQPEFAGDGGDPLDHCGDAAPLVHA